jgi:hypothetical protein
MILAGKRQKKCPGKPGIFGMAFPVWAKPMETQENRYEVS